MDLSILDMYFKSHKYPFTNHQLDSYREFIKSYIPRTIQSYNPITMIKYDDLQNICMKVEIFVGGKDGTKIFVDRPINFEDGEAVLITPNDARLKNLTYESHLYADVIVEITDVEGAISKKEFNKVAIGSIPIMLHSDICVLHNQGSKVLRRLGECVYDTGGYFIINGKEKVIVAQERKTTNRLFVTKLKDDTKYDYKGSIRCTGESGETMLSPRTVEFYLVKYRESDFDNLFKTTDSDDEADKPVEQTSRQPMTIVVRLPSVTGVIPLFTFFRALGIESDKDIYEAIFGTNFSAVEKSFFDDFIRPSICDNKYNIYTQNDAIKYLQSLVKYKTIQHVKYVLTTDVFPNIPIYKNKGRYLGHLIKEFFNVIKMVSPETDKDGYVYKRVDISGYLLAELFQTSYSRLRKHIRDNMDRMYHFGAWSQKKDYENFITKDNVYKLIDNMIVTDTFTKSLKGAWGLSTDKDTDKEQGRVQDLSRISYIGFLSHLRRVDFPIDSSLKITSPHKLHCHQYGIMCPFETPDGASVGYLKNLAFLTKITSGTNPENIRKCLLDIGITLVEDYDKAYDREIAKIFINGSLYAITRNPAYITRVLKAYRRNGFINVLVSISWHIKLNEIRILTEAGRACRPLIIANKKMPDYENWFDLINGSTIELANSDKSDEFYYKNTYINPDSIDKYSGMDMNKILKDLEKNGACIEYLDVEEQDTCYIAMIDQDVTLQHTHLEIHPSTMLSVVTANIPLSNHNQSARNVFHAAQSKQAIGVYATNFNSRFDTMSYVQHYPQRPIVSTQLSQYTCSNFMPNGFNVIVAIMTYSGFNQEDSIMINKQSVERGLFNLSYFKTVTATEKDISQTEKMIFCNPMDFIEKGINVRGNKHADYSLLDKRGVIVEGSVVHKGQRVVVVGMLKVQEVYKEEKKGVFKELVKDTIYTDVSIVTDDTVYGIVNKVYYSEKSVINNSSICKVRFLKIRKPEFGDKHASRHGQKGVVGMIIPEEGMPFTKDGVRPDIIINPHAIPSRMTIGHLVECVFAKLCCMKGTTGNGSVFLPLDEKKIYKDLSKMGFDSHGNELLYNGFTGKQIETEIFIGPTFYFRLKHMVEDKINVRGLDRDKSELPKMSLTRQPTSGRRKGGGLRIGEMERDSILSHGTSMFVQESMMDRSDMYSWAICKRCGTMAIYNPSKKNMIIQCKSCKKDDIAVIKTPYAFKLLTQELETMGIVMRLNTEEVQWDIEKLESERDAAMHGGNAEAGSIPYIEPIQEDSQEDEYSDLEGEDSDGYIESEEGGEEGDEEGGEGDEEAGDLEGDLEDDLEADENIPKGEEEDYYEYSGDDSDDSYDSYDNGSKEIGIQEGQERSDYNGEDAYDGEEGEEEKEEIVENEDDYVENRVEDDAGDEEDFYGEDYNGYNEEPEPVVNNQDEVKVIKIDEKFT